jgi:hypothetical protein
MSVKVGRRNSLPADTASQEFLKTDSSLGKLEYPSETLDSDTSLHPEEKSDCVWKDIECIPSRATTLVGSSDEDFPDGGFRAWLIVFGVSCNLKKHIDRTENDDRPCVSRFLRRSLVLSSI